MAKADLGEKRVCAECAAKFYDLKKRPVVCPKCGFAFDPDAVRRAPRKAAPVPETKEKEKEDDTGDEEDTDGDEESADTSEDEQELTLDDESPLIAGSDGDDDGDGDGSTPSASLPEGYTEEGVEDDSDSLSDDEDEDAKLADEEDLNGDD